MRLVAISGTNYTNAGALLMMRACRERITRLGMVPAVSVFTGTCRQRAEDGAYNLLHLPDHVLDTGTDVGKRMWRLPDRVLALIPSRLRSRGRMCGYVELCAILDASGFKYADRWGAKHVVRTLSKIELCRKNGQAYILLPQAFGPFNNPRVAGPMRDIVQAADLVYARDHESLNYLHELAGASARVRLSPDFTNLLAPAEPATLPRPERFVVVVPNTRMMDKTAADVGDNYVRTMIDVCRILVDRGISVSIMVHESGDVTLADNIRRAAGLSGELVTSHNPLVLKWILGKALFVVGARYHALVGALSQGVPCIGYSWSHKYTGLFADYGCADYLRDVSEKRGVVEQVIDGLLDPAERDRVSTLIKRAAGKAEAQTNRMWSDVERAILDL